MVESWIKAHEVTEVDTEKNMQNLKYLSKGFVFYPTCNIKLLKKFKQWYNLKDFHLYKQTKNLIWGYCEENGLAIWL